MIVPIAPVVSKYFETIRRTETIASFNMIVSIASKARDAGSSAMSLGQTIEFCACFANKPHKWTIFIRKVNLVPWYLLFLLILQHWETRRVPEDILSLRKLDVTDFLQFQITPIRAANIFVLFFRLQRYPSRNFFSITGIKVMSSGIAFDRPDRLSRLRAFPYDRFKIYKIVPIVRIELNSIQAIEVVSVVRVVCDRLGSVSIWSSRSSEHFLRRLGRSGRSYGNQALSTSIRFKLSASFLFIHFCLMVDLR